MGTPVSSQASLIQALLPLCYPHYGPLGEQENCEKYQRAGMGGPFWLASTISMLNVLTSKI